MNSARTILINDFLMRITRYDSFGVIFYNGVSSTFSSGKRLSLFNHTLKYEGIIWCLIPFLEIVCFPIRLDFVIEPRSFGSARCLFPLGHECKNFFQTVMVLLNPNFSTHYCCRLFVLYIH